MKTMNDAMALAKQKGIVLEYAKKGIYAKKQIWYRYDEGINWFWFATSWTKALKRLKELGRKTI
tara:strand:- start:2526 stop:2717 length:192 start_codon:yes stop_codon:yes gene_type:complete